MCGILGVRRAWLDDRARVERALASLAWRGPDGALLCEVGGWWLGVARLSITDPSAAQPIVCPRTGRAVAFNGAVTSAADEWHEYRDESRTRNDAELLLLRLGRHGPERLADMTGPYAFAVVDPDGDRLWLGRDPMGEKPLFVLSRGDRIVAFASSVACLRALGVDVRLDAVERARFLRFGLQLGPAAGDGLELSSTLAGVVADRIDAAVACDPPRRAPRGQPLAAAVEAAVGRCARAEVPLGVCLSGGIDSACLAVALDHHGVHGNAYQLRAVGEPEDERELARLVARATGQTLRPVDAGPDVLRTLPELTRATGLPVGDPSTLLAHALARAARRDGVKVLLSGEGADDLLLGYDRHRAARFLPRRGFAWLWAPPLATGRLARTWRALAAPRPYDSLLEVAPPGFLATVAPRAAAAPLPNGSPSGSALARAREVDRAVYLRHDLLPKLDAALMLAGVEGRCPYLDPAVLASDAVAEPDPRRVLGKRALRAAFAARLPAAVLAERKRGFAAPLDRWLRDDDWLADLLRDRRTRAREHVDGRGLGAMLDRHRAGSARLGHALYLVAAWEVYERVVEEAP